MPVFVLKCIFCKKERELHLTDYARLEEVIKVLPCDHCGKIGWEKLPTIPTIRFKGNGWGR